jgi:hypothetical protein
MIRRSVAALLAVLLGLGAIAATAPDSDAANGLRKPVHGSAANGL